MVTRWTIFGAALAVWGCSQRDPIGFLPTDDAGTDALPAADDAALTEAAGCDNLECQIPQCDGGTTTTIQGVVFDPAAKNPLYNVYVYVPNRPLDPIPDGPVCATCQAPASGKPLVATSTDAQGRFVLKGAPAGTNIPLVMQVGKWRRMITLSNVDPCVDNHITDKSLTRLPRKEGEGNIPENHLPKIAFTTGCDMAQCFLLNRIGIDASEFTGPLLKGRVHVYGGRGATADGMTKNTDPKNGPPNMGDAAALWGNLATMKKYDMIFNSCECDVYERDTQGPGYDNMKAYLDSGGRLFATHYHYNFFASKQQCNVSAYQASYCHGPADFNKVADWIGETNTLFSGVNDTDFTIDTTFPKGKAFADWLDNVNKTSNVTPLPMYGHANLVDVRQNALNVNAPSSRYIYTKNFSYYFSWNTPTQAQVMNQCGRAVFSAVHVSGEYFPFVTGFPQFCSAPGQNEDHSANERALEFLFYDLSSCVGDDALPPPLPPPN